MHWTTLTDVVRALAAGVTAIIVTFKFIQELRQKQAPQPDDPEPETSYLEETADDEADDGSCWPNDLKPKP